MLSISHPMSGRGRGQYYTDLARDDYYANRNEKAGEWYGKAADKLGLKGSVTAAEFQNLLDGLTPDGTQKLVQNALSEKRTCGWDFTFSAPKSVSVFWAMAPPEVRAEIEAAHLASVKEALDYLEEKGGITRRGKAGKNWESASLVVAIFEHAASRALDPGLHSHAFVINSALRADGSWGSLHSKLLFEHRFNAETVYHLSLALRLRLEIGLRVEMQKPAFRLPDVPEDLCYTFSKRSRAIKEFKKERGLEGTAAGKLAALATRPKKQNLSREELFKYWHRVGEAHAFGPKQAEEILNRRRLTTTSEFASGKTSSLNSTFSEEKQQAEDAAWIHEQFAAETSRRNRIVILRSPTSYRLKNRRWGDILWQKKIGWFEFRIQQRRMFPHAPSWSPASKIEPPAFRIIPKKIQFKKSVPPWKRPEPKIHWKKDLLLAELQLVDKELFPDAPWGVARRLKLRRLRFAKKTPKSDKSHQQREVEEQKKRATAKQSH